MVDDEGEDQRNTDAEARMFFVRLGANDDALFALCERVGTKLGTHIVPGTGKTVAELVSEQRLLAAGIRRDVADELSELAEGDQSAENVPGGSSGN